MRGRYFSQFSGYDATDSSTAMEANREQPPREVLRSD
jgi:hypothetical protein